MESRTSHGGRTGGPILVVEDDPDVREALTLILEDEGYQVDSAAQGQEALDRLRGPSPPSLVLLDLMLPVMDGFEFRVQQMQDPALADIPVIVFSGGGDLGGKVAPLRADACFPKPVDIPALLASIAERCPPTARRPLRRAARTRARRAPSPRR